MASNSPPSQWQKGDLWDTDPNTFIAREAVKRLDLTECYLSDDAIMKFLINKREKTIRSANISKFNETEFVKGGFLRSRHKGRGAPALAPDGTVMTVVAGAHHSSTIVLNGGDRSLPVGTWSLENYQAKIDHPGYKEWLAKIKWTSADALRAGIPLTSINATLTAPRRSVQQNPIKSERTIDELQGKKAGSPQFNEASGFAVKGQPNNASGLTYQGHGCAPPTHLVTPQEVPPSEYATLPSTYSGITTPHLTTPRASFSGPGQPRVADSEPASPESAFSDPVVSESATSEPAISKPVISQPAALKPTIFEHTAPDPATSKHATLVPISEPDALDLAAFQPVASVPTASYFAVSEPIAPELTVFESPTSELAASDSVVARPTVPEPTDLQPGASQLPVSKSTTLERSTSEPIMAKPAGSESVGPEPLLIVSKRAASELTPMEYFPLIGIQAEINPPEAPKPNILQGQAPASIQNQSASACPAFLKLGSESTRRLSVDRSSMELTTPKTSVPAYCQQFNPRQPSLEIPETPPPLAHYTVNSYVSRESTQVTSPETSNMPHSSPGAQPVSTANQATSSQIISPVANRIKHNHATLSDAPSSPRSLSTINQAVSFQSPPSTPVSKGPLKRKATEPL